MTSALQQQYIWLIKASIKLILDTRVCVKYISTQEYLKITMN